jgi:hypothetical protein
MSVKSNVSGHFAGCPSRSFKSEQVCSVAFSEFVKFQVVCNSCSLKNLNIAPGLFLNEVIDVMIDISL